MATAADRAARWHERIIHDGGLGVSDPPAWLLESYGSFRQNVMDPAYPCFFGTLAERRGEMFYTYVDDASIEHLPRNMLQFIELSKQRENEKNNLAVFFEPSDKDFDHEQFRSFCWQTLQYLADSDPEASADGVLDPSDAAWEFSFAGMQMFVVGCSPTYRQRRSRNLGRGIVLLFQPRSVFIDAITNREISVDARSQIRRRIQAWDGMPAHPDMGMYGDPQNREWKQYFLPDDAMPESGVCPFHAKRVASVPAPPVLAPSRDNLVARVRYWAGHSPDVIAVRFLIDGSEEVSLSFKELDSRSRALAQQMLAHAAPGERALILLPSGLDFIVAFVACMYARIVAVPAFPIGGNARHAARVLAIAADCDPKLVLTDGDDVSAVAPARIVIDLSQAIQRSPAWLPTPAAAGDLAFLQYTSGSTGTPKGVMVNHGSLSANLQVLGRAFQASPSAVMANWLPLYHDMGLIAGVLLPIYFGFPVVLMTPHHFIGSPLRWLRAI